MTNIRELPTSGDRRQAVSSNEPTSGHNAAEFVWLTLAARAAELRRANVLDDASFAAVARALETARRAGLAGDATADLIAAIVQRAEAVLPAELSGVLTLGGANEEVAATLLRLTVRDAALQHLEHIEVLRAALLSLADEHTITLMPALVGGRPAQPTTFAHFLGGVVAPLAVASGRMRHAYADLNRSPLGAAVFTGDVIDVDRTAMATSLGFEGAIGNTFNAVADVEDVVGCIEATAASVAPVRRFVDELRGWLRTDPNSLQLSEEWLAQPEPGLPHLSVPRRVDMLASSLREVERAAARAVDLLRSLDYGPIGGHVDALLAPLTDLTDRSHEALREAHRLISSGLTVNRAWLANRAGRGFTTSGDLAAFLMAEESLPPSVAVAIAGNVIGRTMVAGAEVTAITPEAIDLAAMLIIGRELKVEVEALGRYLAPRRFLERRSVAGSPAPERTRAWLAEERAGLEADRAGRERERDRVEGALTALVATMSEAAAQAD